MTITSRRRRRLGIIAFLAVAVLSACVTPAAQRRASTPAPCTDSTYVQLKRQHPDSSSERGWQRLQSLDSACAAARTHATETSVIRSGHNGWMGMGRGVAVGLMAALMATMIITMR